MFWKTIIPLFTKRPLKGEKINLIQNGKNISNDTELCNIFNSFFSNIISEHSLPKKCHCFLKDMGSDSVVINISKIYEKLLYNRLSKYFDSLLATYQCGFREGFSSCWKSSRKQ